MIFSSQDYIMSWLDSLTNYIWFSTQNTVVTNNKRWQNAREQVNYSVMFAGIMLLSVLSFSLFYPKHYLYESNNSLLVNSIQNRDDIQTKKNILQTIYHILTLSLSENFYTMNLSPQEVLERKFITCMYIIYIHRILRNVT